MGYPIIKVNRNTAAYYRIISAGFRISGINLIKIATDFYRASIKFRCVCGTIEEFTSIYYSKHEIPKRLDVAKMIENANALSIEHLQKDGYSSTQIAMIRKVYD